MHFKNEETNIQVAGVSYLRAKYPEALFTIAPNGVKLPVYIAKMFKAMGYRAGTPDIMLFEPRGGYHGAFFEVKTPQGETSPVQKAVLKALDQRDYMTYVCYGYEGLVKAIDLYLGEVTPL